MPWVYNHFNNINSSNPRTWYIFLSVCVIVYFFHQCLRVSQVHIFCLLQFSSVAQSCPTLCDPINRSTPGLPVHHQLLEFTQTHVSEFQIPGKTIEYDKCPRSSHPDLATLIVLDVCVVWAVPGFCKLWLQRLR